MTLEEKKMEFTVFCIENVAEQMNELPEHIYSRLNNLGLVDDLLFGCYDTLHTQSKQHIVEDIILALKVREKGEASCLLNQTLIDKCLHFIDSIDINSKEQDHVTSE